MRKSLAVIALAVFACSDGGSDTPKAAKPTFTPPGGTYAAAQSVSIASATPGAVIRYTTDGSTPTATSAVYASPIAVSTTTTLKAYATADGYTDSTVASATYTITLPAAAAPTFSPPAGPYTTAQSVVLASTTPGAVIRYTTDGSTPTAASPVYAAALEVATTTTLRAYAAADGFQDSPVASATYTIGATAAAPTFAPAGGTYPTAQNVALASTTPGAVIRYTTDGSDPTAASTVYAAPIPVAATTTLKAYAVADGYLNSPIVSATYTIEALPVAAAPTFDPPGGTYTTAQTVALSSTTPGAVIRYTTDGSTPTSASTVYAGPIQVAQTTTVRAYASADGFADSPVSSTTYTIGQSSLTFAELCGAMFGAQASLWVECLHANPDYLAAENPWMLDTCDALQKEIAAGRVTYHAAQAQACRDALSGLTCDALVSQTFPAACETVLTGTVANGGVCYQDAGCQDGWCDDTSTCPGQCRAFVPESGSCAFLSECAPGLECEAGTCVAPSAAGGPCPCQAGLWCDLSGEAGTCRPQQTSGACDDTSGAFTDQCAIGYLCVGSPATCQPMVGLDGSCLVDEALCGFGYRCFATTCEPEPGLGQACTGLCIGGYCDPFDQICKAYHGVGAACVGPWECVSGACTNGKCVAPFCSAP